MSEKLGKYPPGTEFKIIKPRLIGLPAALENMRGRVLRHLHNDEFDFEVADNGTWYGGPECFDKGIFQIVIKENE